MKEPSGLAHPPFHEPPVVNDQANSRATTLLDFWVPWGMS